ncbi:hypothetical protein PCYB_093430, partial [Plasmodium cynomolgi strain B]
VLIQDLDGLTVLGAAKRSSSALSPTNHTHTLCRDAKNKRHMQDIRENMHKYFRAYFETVLSSGESGRRSGGERGSGSSGERGSGSSPCWRHELTKIILLKLACPEILDILNKESIKEMLKNVNKSVRYNPSLLILLKDEFLQLLKNESSMYYHLVSEKVLQIVAENTKRMDVTYDDIEKYYVTLHSFFCGGDYTEVKFWVSLIHAFTNIAICCHDFSESVLRVYSAFLSRSDVTLMLKHIVTEHVGMIKNVFYAKEGFFFS